jgi:predicted RNA-binding protein with PIN domain
VPVLVDGHNLIGRLPTISLDDPDDELKLVMLLTSYRARTHKAVTVVFDPGETFTLSEKHRHGGVEVVFAPHGSSADAVIARRIQHSRNPRSWLVVTSDRELAETVARGGARVRSAEEFAGELSPPHKTGAGWKGTPPSPQEVEDWLNLFRDQD